MSDPISRTRFLPQHSLETWQPVGELDSLMVVLVASYVSFEEMVRPEPFNRFTDLSRLTGISLDLRDLIEIGTERCAASSGRPAVKSAIVAPRRETSEVARVFANLMEPSPVDVRVFPTVEEAARWLGVPASALE